VVEQARFLLGEDDDPTGPIRESLEHVAPFPGGDDVEPVYRCALAGAAVIDVPRRDGDSFRDGSD
jgi:hypothetical protein